MGSYLTNQIMYWDNLKVSDHGRSPLEVSPEKIERKDRMVRGTMRKYHVATKRTWSTSWDMLPTLSAEVVDGGMTGPEMKDFYDSTTGPFTITFRDGQGNQTTAQAMFVDFSHTVEKRGFVNDFWNVNVTLEEV